MGFLVCFLDVVFTPFGFGDFLKRQKNKTGQDEGIGKSS